MRILAIETVATTGSVAALDDESVIAARPLDPSRRSAQSLAPGMSELLRQVGWRPADVQLVAVATGPGSFTGLRIGVTMAKTFAYAAGCQVLGVHTLLAIASRAPAEISQLSVVLDAQRRELFVSDFQRGPQGEWIGREQTQTRACQAWLESLAIGCTVTGPGLRALADRLPSGVVVIAPELWAPDAESVGRVASHCYAAGARQTAFELVPRYFRRTAAEEQWERRQATE